MERDFKVRKQMRNGEIKYGITVDEKDDSFVTALPFKYEKILEKAGQVEGEKGGNRIYFYFIFYDANGKEGIFLDGDVILPSEKYYDIEVLPCGNKQNFYCKVCKTVEDAQLTGILHINVKDKEVVETYSFGKADEIEVNDDRVNLYKKVGGKKLIGVFQDKDLGTLEPEYTFLDYQKFNIPEKKTEKLPWRKFDNDCMSARVKKDEIGILHYGKIKDGKEFQGLLSRVRSQEVELVPARIEELERILDHVEFYDADLAKENHKWYKETETEWEELVPCEYRGIFFSDHHNDEIPFQQFPFRKRNFLNLVNEKDDKKVYGAQIYSLVSTKSNEDVDELPKWQIKPMLTIPCQYDERFKTLKSDLDPFNKKYLLTKEDNKEGLMKLAIEYQNGNGAMPTITLEKMLENIYDNISPETSGYYSDFKTFIFEQYDDQDLLKSLNHTKKGLIYDLKNRDGEFLKTACQYDEIDSLINNQKHVLTDQFNRKSAFILKRIEDGDVDKEPVYDFAKTPAIYKKILPLTVSGFFKSQDLLVGIKDGDLKDVMREDKTIVDNIIRGIYTTGECFYFERLADNGEREKCYMAKKGDVLLADIPINQKVHYFSEINCFAVEEEEFLRVVPRKDKTFELPLLEGLYSKFEMTILPNCQSVIKYKKHSNQRDEKYGLLKCCNEEDEIKITEILDNKYASLEVVSDGEKTIVGDSKDYHIEYGLEEKTENPKVRYGMVDNEEGAVCIPFKFDELSYYQESITREGGFIGEKHEDGKSSYIAYDKDGYKSGELTEDEWKQFNEENEEILKLRKKI